jgi:hypothetical protein
VGTSGVGVFDDDTASDVRADFRDAIGDGLSPEAATARLVKQYGPDDADVGPVFWLALAAAQWSEGRLVESVKKEAPRVIGDEGDLARFDDPQVKKKRAALLAKLANQLGTPPPAAKPARKELVQACDWLRGELVIYRTASGTDVHLRVFDLQQSGHGVAPVARSWTSPPERSSTRRRSPPRQPDPSRPAPSSDVPRAPSRGLLNDRSS